MASRPAQPWSSRTGGQLRLTTITVHGGPPSTAHAWFRPLAANTETINGSPATVYGLAPDPNGLSGWNSTHTVPLPIGGLAPGKA